MPVPIPSRVLLVEDDALLRECLTELLGDAGYHIAPAVDAAEALGQMEANGTPDVLVTDLWLGSGANGLALIAEARRRWPRLRAVLTSGDSTARFGLHPDDLFVGKPFNVDALVRAVAKLATKPALLREQGALL